MSITSESIKIPKNVSTENDLDFAWLKKKGIEYIESLGGGLWTDFNDHDPGVTMLEMLCYAITDLGNRIEMPIEQILARENTTSLGDQFYQAHEILVSAPVTPLDYRKLFLDIRGVHNAWILAYQQSLFVNCRDNILSYDEAIFTGLPKEHQQTIILKGLNYILVEYDDDVLEDDDDPRTKAEINADIEAAYHANRNLCEDLVEIREVGLVRIAVCTDIELHKNADKDLVHAKILTEIENYFSPDINWYSLKEMMSKGYRTDEIFEGPLLNNGFIDTGELENSNLRKEVRLSDIINILMDIEGVKIVKEITLKDCQGNESDDWSLCIGEGVKPVLAPTTANADPEEECDLRSVFNYSKDVLPVVVNQSKVDAYIAGFKEDRVSKNALAKLNARLKIKEGKFVGIDTTTTIQNDFPDTYGISPLGLPSTAGPHRKVQALQLKGYLLFFDQILASYFAHLGKVRDLFALDRGLLPTYFTQAVKDLTNFDALVSDYPANDDDLLAEKILSFLDNNIERRNEILDHLLARFAEQFSEYSFLMSELYGEASDELIIASKEQFLKEYVELSRDRSRGFDYTSSSLWDTSNVSGSQKRIARLAGIKNYQRRNLSDSFVSVYEETIAPDTFVRWKVADTGGNTILEYVQDYTSVSEATKDLYKVLYELVNTTADELEDAFAAPIAHGQEVGGIALLTTPDFGFTVLHPDITDPLLRIIGKNSMTYTDQDSLKTGLLEIIDFAKNKFTEEGIYIVEHILLRPQPMDETAAPETFLPICTDDCKDCCTAADPYSFRVSVVLPGFTQRFSVPEFRYFMETLIEQELPAHVLPRICWIGNRKGTEPDAENELMQFESTWKAFLEAHQTLNFNPELIAFKDVLTDLHTIYPTGRLHDCKTDELEGKIILGRTNLGTQ